MPRLPGAFLRALDANGDASSGAKLYVYKAGTTTPVTTYSDEGLTTANAFPVVADSSGAWGAIYLSGGQYKVTVTTSADVTLPGYPMDDLAVGGERLEAAAIADAAALTIYPQSRVYIRGAQDEDDGGGGWYDYSASDPGPTGGTATDAGGYFYRLSSRPFGPQQMAGADDDTKWENFTEYAENELADGLARGGFMEGGNFIDGGGKSWTLTQDVSIVCPVHLDRMKIAMRACTLTLDAATIPGVGAGQRVPHTLGRDFTAVFDDALGADYAGPLVDVPNCAGFASYGHLNAGLDTYRAQHALRVGGTAAWALQLWGGSIRGGEEPLVIGNTGDMTGSAIGGAIVIDRGRRANAVICNPNGLDIQGGIEHWEGSKNLVILSGVGGSNTTRNVRIHNCYMYSPVAAAHTAGASIIQIGGSYSPLGLTGTNSARGIDIERNYLVCDEADVCIDCQAVEEVRASGNAYRFSSSGANFASYSGTCARTYHGINVELNGTTTPDFASTASNRILADRVLASFAPVLEGSTSTGTYTTATSGGTWRVREGDLVLHGQLEAHSFSGFSGSINIVTPNSVELVSGAARHGGAVTRAYGWDESGTNHPVEVELHGSEAFLRIYVGNTATRMSDADLPTGTDPLYLNFEITFPVDLAA